MQNRPDRNRRRGSIPLLFVVLGLVASQVQGTAQDARSPSGNGPAEKASLVLHAAQKSPYNVPRFLTGKFCEHLYFNATKDHTYKLLDTPGAQTSDGSLLLSIVNKGTEKPVDLSISLKDFRPAGTMEVQTLSANVPWATNTLEAPAAIAPVITTKELRGAELSLRLPPYSFTLVRIPAAQAKPEL